MLPKVLVVLNFVASRAACVKSKTELAKCTVNTWQVL